MKDFISTTELATLMGISRIAIFQKIQQGHIPAKKVGRNFIIAKKDVAYLFGRSLRASDKADIQAAVKKVVKEYGQTLKLLAKE